MSDDFEERVALEVQKRIDDLLADPRTVIAAYQKQHAEDAQVIIDQGRLLEKQEPKVSFYDTVTQSDSWSDMMEIAKLIGRKGWGRNNIFDLLRDRKVVRYNREPYQEYVERGYFKIVEKEFFAPYSDLPQISTKTVVSQKGLDYIRRLIEEYDA